MLAVAAALARAFPAVPLLARAAAELAVLAEMTVGGPAAIARIQRLLAPPASPGLPVRAARLAAGLAVLMIPVVITSVPLAMRHATS